MHSNINVTMSTMDRTVLEIVSNFLHENNLSNDAFREVVPSSRLNPHERGLIEQVRQLKTLAEYANGFPGRMHALTDPSPDVLKALGIGEYTTLPPLRVANAIAGTKLAITDSGNWTRDSIKPGYLDGIRPSINLRRRRIFSDRDMINFAGIAHPSGNDLDTPDGIRHRFHTLDEIQAALSPAQRESARRAVAAVQDAAVEAVEWLAVCPDDGQLRRTLYHLLKSINAEGMREPDFYHSKANFVDDDRRRLDVLRCSLYATDLSRLLHDRHDVTDLASEPLITAILQSSYVAVGISIRAKLIDALLSGRVTTNSEHPTIYCRVLNAAGEIREIKMRYKSNWLTPYVLHTAYGLDKRTALRVELQCWLVLAGLYCQGQTWSADVVRIGLHESFADPNPPVEDPSVEDGYSVSAGGIHYYNPSDF